MAQNKTTIVAEPGSHEVIVTRMFDAPRTLVFQVMNAPDLLSQWWGPAILSTSVETYHPRSGSNWRVIQRDPEGHEHGFHGVYHEVTAPERMVRTFEYEGAPGHVAMETWRFEDVNGKTRLTSQMVFQSVAARDGMLKAGMEGGTEDTYNRLDALLLAQLELA